VLEEQFKGRVVNYAFESRIVNDELVFDYRLKHGVAESTNATFLLKKMNIV
jgi:DNA mismatch repair ATPase MutS